MLNRREMLGLSAGAIAGTALAGLKAEEKPAAEAPAAPIKTRMFWTWDHSTEWSLNWPGAQTMGALNPYFRSKTAFEYDYTNLLKWCGEHHIDAVVIWGLLRDGHGGVDSAKKLCEVAAKHNVRILCGVGLCAYGGVYYEGGSPWSMAQHLEKHPELYAVRSENGDKMRSNFHACPSKKENQDYVAESLKWLFKTLPLGGVQMETGDTGVCHCAKCNERRKHATSELSFEDMALMYPIATEAIRSVSPDAMVVCETYTNPMPHSDPKVQGGFGQKKPSWADECIDQFPKNVFVQWVCDNIVHQDWTKAANVSNENRRHVMRAHFGTYWNGKRGELSLDNIAKMVQRSMAANFDAISLFGEVSPHYAGAELNYLALENFGSAANPKADLDVFLDKVAGPLLGSPELARKFVDFARPRDNNERNKILPDIYAQVGKHPAPIAHRWAWLGEYLHSYVEG